MRITIVLDSPNPDLVAKVREGLNQWWEQGGLDMDATDRFYDLAVNAVADVPTDNGYYVFGWVNDGEENNADEVQKGYWLDELGGGLYTVVDEGGNPQVYGITRLEAHDKHGVTLHDCKGCAAGLSQIHAFEAFEFTRYLLPD